MINGSNGLLATNGLLGGSYARPQPHEPQPAFPIYQQPQQPVDKSVLSAIHQLAGVFMNGQDHQRAAIIEALNVNRDIAGILDAMNNKPSDDWNVTVTGRDKEGRIKQVSFERKKDSKLTKDGDE